MASSVMSVRFTENADGKLNRNYDGDALSIDDSVLILTGKYKGCEGVVEKVSSSNNKVKVRRQCGDGRRGDGKTWWYKPGQVEELIEDDVEEAPAEEDLSEDQDISLVMNLGMSMNLRCVVHQIAVAMGLLTSKIFQNTSRGKRGDDFDGTR